jgi:hypothetical protein
VHLDSDGKLAFPCRYPVKAMTRSDDRAVSRVVDAVAAAGVEPERDSVTIRPSRNGRFQSITVVVRAGSRRELEAAYRRLRAMDIVVMTL